MFVESETLCASIYAFKACKQVKNQARDDEHSQRSCPWRENVYMHKRCIGGRLIEGLAVCCL